MGIGGPKMDGQLDVPTLMFHLAPQAHVSAQAFQFHVARILIRLNNLNVDYSMCAQFARQMSVYARSFLATTVKGLMQRGRSFVLRTAITTVVGKFFAMRSNWSPTL